MVKKMRNLIVFTAILAIAFLGSAGVANATDPVDVNTSNAIAIQGESRNNSGSAYGVVALARTPNSSDNIGVYGYAANTGAGRAYSFYGDGGVLYNSGNVGIGTAYPSTKLDVQTSNATAIQGESRNNSGSAYGVVALARTPNSSDNIGVYGYGANTGGGRAYSFYGDGGVLYNSGNVGIGTTAPAAKLHVVGDIIADNIDVLDIDALDVSVVIDSVPVSVGASIAALLARVNAIEAALSKPGASGISRYGQ